MDSRGLKELMDSLQISVAETQIGEMQEILSNIRGCINRNSQRQEMTEPLWKTLLDVLEIGKNIFQNECPLPEEFDLLADAFRCLRNMCAGCCQDDQLVISSKDLLKIPMDILILLVERRSNASEKEIIVLRCCLQFFGNVVCQSITSKYIIWQLFNQKNFFKILLSDPDFKVQETVMMILYHCMRPSYENYLLSTPEGPDVLISLTDALCSNVIDWGILILESIVCDQAFIENCYKRLPTRNRLLVLDVVIELFANATIDIPGISEYTLNSIKNIFMESVQNIKVPNSHCEALKSIETIRLLSVLCAASVDRKLGPVFKCYGDLLEISIETLKMIHLLGKESCNAFSKISNPRNVPGVSEEEIKNDGSYCFKKNLVRLIGNMCVDCRQNQDLVRKLDGIPLLLDCCNLDLRNPYIMQWCILAIHNVLENNHENQEVLAQTTLTQELVDSPLLKELGLTVHIDNGRLVLKSQTP